LLEALTELLYNSQSAADSYQEQQYSSEVGEWAKASNPRDAERSTLAGTPTSSLETKS